jgi:hypothetical protein
MRKEEFFVNYARMYFGEVQLFDTLQFTAITLMIPVHMHPELQDMAQWQSHPNRHNMACLVDTDRLIKTAAHVMGGGGMIFLEHDGNRSNNVQG